MNTTSQQSTIQIKSNPIISRCQNTFGIIQNYFNWHCEILDTFDNKKRSSRRYLLRHPNSLHSQRYHTPIKGGSDRHNFVARDTSHPNTSSKYFEKRSSIRKYKH